MSVRLVRLLTVSIGVIVASALLSPASATATTGFLDKTFNGNGRVLTNVAGDDSGQAVAVQADGKIVVTGATSGGTDVALVRYNTDGSLDTSFGGGNGIVVTDVSGDDSAESIAIQPDQKIVVGGFTDGTSQALLLRYDTSGSLDSSFGGGDGIVTTTIGAGAVFNDLAIQGDGSIVAAGAMTPDGVKGLAVVARYDSSGVLDTANFASPDGYVTTTLGAGGGQMTGVALDGTKIVTAGTSYSSTSSNVAVLRYTSAGVLDTTFSNDGKVSTDVASGYDMGGDVAVDADGNIDVVGAGGNKDVFLRYDDTGVLDTSFGGGDGIAFAGRSGFNGFSGIAIRGSGEIVAVDSGFGNSYLPTGDFKAVQVTSAGVLDTTFGDNGMATASFQMNFNGGEPPVANDVAIDGNGAVVVAGTAGTHNDFAVARFGDAANAVIGRPDLLIGTGGTLIGDGVYNSTGHNETISRHVARGKTLSFSIEVQNDGNASDVITVLGQRVRGLAITYHVGTNDVTKAVLGFQGKPFSVDPGGSKTLKVRAKVSAKATVGKVLKLRTLAVSLNATDREDLVVAAITVKR